MRLREQIKALELRAEKLQLEALESLAATEKAPAIEAGRVAENAMTNLVHYAEAEGLDVNAEIRSLFAAVIAAAFPGGHASQG